jgi:hypothetical protein
LESIANSTPISLLISPIVSDIQESSKE